MRILAIRGENLASLAAAFEIDFDAPPLGDVGLFAISGPTGSGKSTILDALCLALFDTIPRLPAGHGVPVGRADEDEALRLRNTDVRSILRRGAPEGHAEVDFIGNDGERFRARWEVRRARRRANGKVQAQQLSLTNLKSGDAIGHTKTEVLHAIQERLGLNFDQFRRSVLLAQGDFAAFLRASSDERAGLLERITGTGLYTALSREAFRRAGAEQAALDRLQARRQGHAPLDGEERAALQVLVREARQAVEALTGQKTGIRQGLDWYAKQEGLSLALDEARKTLSQAQAAFDQAEGRRRQLQQVRSVQPYRSVADNLRDVQKRVEQVELARSEARAAVQGGEQALESAQRRSEETAAALRTATEALEQAKPLLIRARELDTRIGIAAKALEEVAERHRAGLNGLQQARERVASIRQRKEDAGKKKETSEAWLAEHREYALLAAEWPRWRRELDRFDRIIADRRRLAGELAANAQQREQAQSAHERQVAELHGIEQGLEEKRGQREQARQEAAALSPGELRERRKRLNRRQERLTQRLSLSRQAQRLQQAVNEDSARLEQARRTHGAATAARDAAHRELPIRQARLSEADDAFQLALAARDQQVLHLRSLLRDNRPCPVCGSEQHPWRTEPAALDETVSRLKQRVGELKRQRDGLEQQLSRSRGEIESADQAMASATRSLSVNRQELEALEIDWKALPEDAFSDRGLTDPELPSSLEAALAEDRTQLDAVEDGIRTAEALAARIEALGNELEALRRDQGSAQTRVHQAGEALRELERQQRSLTSDQQRLDAEFAAAAADVTDAFTPLRDWRQAVSDDPAAFARRCETWVKRWGGAETERDRTAEILIGLDKTSAEAEVEMRSLATACETLSRDQAHRESTLGQLTGERAGLLQGRPTGVVERELEQALAGAQGQADGATGALNGARTAQAKARQLLQERGQVLELERQRSAEARTALDGVLRKTGLNQDQLQALLDFGADWTAAEAAALDAIRDARQQAGTVVEERQKALAQHAAGRPDVAKELLVQRQAENAAALEAATEHATARAFALRQDDENRTRWNEMGAEIEQQAAVTRLWASLNDLIGSADGKKFRVFAQSLTLEALLGYANAHLKELSHRYRLQRVPGSDLDLQIIDADMGDEVRSVHSLSGGESFLVSLALALGLASLSSQRAQVESLFIDEGFGSLDQDALDVAISSLDSLQSLGRRVGVISHVQTLVERIGTRVAVESIGGGRSLVRVLAV